MVEKGETIKKQIIKVVISGGAAYALTMFLVQFVVAPYQAAVAVLVGMTLARIFDILIANYWK